VVVGDTKQEPRLKEIVRLLRKPEVSVVANLLAVDPEERPRFLANLLPEIAKLRSEAGRPHWLLLDEAHHCLPAKWDPAPVTLPKELPAAIAITVHPEAVARDFLELVSTVVGVGDGSRNAIEAFRTATGRRVSNTIAQRQPDQVHLLLRDGSLVAVTPVKPKEKQKRHARKYAEGDLGDRSFYFRGPDGDLNLRAQNLSTFLQMAEGIDDKTWLHHLQAREYSKWFREAIKDEGLALDASAVEAASGLSAKESRQRLKEIIERRYTAPASKD
jgi:hypothetical protein